MIATTLAILALAAAPDSPASPEVRVSGVREQDFPRIAIQFELVRPDGSHVRDARREEFQVEEEGRPVAIDDFQAPVTTEQIPTTLVLVLDRSGSMMNEDRIGGLKRAVSAFLSRLPAGSRVAVIAFGSEVEELSPFTTDFESLEDQVHALRARGATRFYDAVDRALRMLQDEPGRRAVLALTDGEDTDSQDANLDSLIATSRRLGLPVYTLGLGNERRIRADDLRQLAEATRARYFPARRADELTAIYEQIAERIGSTYLLAYRTDRPVPDGTLRPIQIAYRQGVSAGKTAVFIPGMVVPVGGWSPIFLALAATLAALGLLPRRRSRSPASPSPCSGSTPEKVTLSG